MNVTSLSFPYGESIQWFSPDAINSMPQSALKEWLLATGSLTQKLKGCCHDFEVKVLGEQLTTPLAGECPQQKQVWVREVLLCLDGEPWVFARTLIPENLANDQHNFKALGKRPLGELLFTSADIVPGKIEVAEFESCTKLAQLATRLSQPVTSSLWGRRRYFNLANQDIIVSEIFLPYAVKQINALTLKQSC
ncbi:MULTISPECIES: chorismate lyase [unclassified Shewanella]|uniref:chorismate--pyruvate lyase family protein n=1 Tax=unclassified Shewanella TaxID=196818 RepID=UPI000C82F16E|nr:MULTISPECIES: chorismate lyase [unclassified Shewanella]MDO6619666.1 chorismate lyase [Shewanella sp. 6_MG-2023]MDO6640621.1 chorismate lyase [Shewanella sp. 5_MG-2023]MDO6678754.1 chorismate lyase [Shewanella sp. 4_MG-2023]MDO6775770.1 chorismate lyase [Shewanella sp. 3_MG-2023]PMG29155.1 chorismate--pyruvate lyase [Shewanella sp. 10N.286.52.C2]